MSAVAEVIIKFCESIGTTRSGSPSTALLSGQKNKLILL